MGDALALQKETKRPSQRCKCSRFPAGRRWETNALAWPQSLILCGSCISLSTMMRAGALLKSVRARRSEEHTSELQSLMRISYAVFCLKKKTTAHKNTTHNHN